MRCKNTKKENKIFIIISTVITIVMLVLSMTLIITTASARKNNQVPKVLGNMFFIVATDSMTPELKVGDFIFVTDVEKEDIKEGDFIIFHSQEPQTKGMIIVHSVSRIVEEQGEIKFYTQGIKEGLPEDTHPTSEVIGIYKGKSQVLGFVMKLLYVRKNLIMFVIIALFVWIAIGQVKKIVKEIKQERINQRNILQEQIREQIANEDLEEDDLSEKVENDFKDEIKDDKTNNINADQIANEEADKKE